MRHRHSTIAFPWVLLLPVCLASPLALLMFSTVHLHDSFGLPFHLLPCGFHSMTIHVMFSFASLFQITFKGRVSTRNFEGSLHVGFRTSSQVYFYLFCWVRWPTFLGFWPETPFLSETLHLPQNMTDPFPLRSFYRCFYIFLSSSCPQFLIRVPHEDQLKDFLNVIHSLFSINYHERVVGAH